MSRATCRLIPLIVVAAVGAAWIGSRSYPPLAYPAALLTLAGVYVVGCHVGKRRAARRLARRGGRAEREAASPIVDSFHELYYDSMVFAHTSWLGTPALKCPLDLWVYQEIIHELRPDVIVETGTASGGSARFLASICDLLGHGEIITIDVEERPGRPQHSRITYLQGSSTDPAVLERVRSKTQGRDRVLVLLDSDHRKAHVLSELTAYSELVTPGSYLIVEDTNLGHPARPDFGPGPMEAVVEFLADHPEFANDPSREKHLLTFNPRGYLRRKGGGPKRAAVQWVRSLGPPRRSRG
jgi:cephalosporin hydroxylase